LVESVSVGEGLFRANATLAILAQSESDKFGYHIDTRKIEKRIELSELVAGHYISVKKALFPPKTKKATVTLEQLKAMFVGKRLHIIDSEESFLDTCSTGICKEVRGSGNDYAVRMDMDEAFMGQKESTIAFHVETVTSTSVEGPLLAQKGGRRKIEIIG
jgi:hypothetical protein